MNTRLHTSRFTFKLKPLRPAAILTVAVLACSTLSACAPLVIGSAVGGTMLAMDRRTSGTQIEDKSIELKAGNRISELMGDKAHVNANAYNRVVLLTGEAPSEADKAKIGETVARIDNVRNVINELAVAGNSSLTTRSSDVLIAAKIKATFVDARDVMSNAFDVVVERGEVYLMGRVTEREANRATELARSVGGVLKVVRVFEIITEEELARMPASNRPTPEAASAPR